MRRSPHEWGHIIYLACSDWYAPNGRYVPIGLAGFAIVRDTMSSFLVWVLPTLQRRLVRLRRTSYPFSQGGQEVHNCYQRRPQGSRGRQRGHYRAPAKLRKLGIAGLPWRYVKTSRERCLKNCSQLPGREVWWSTVFFFRLPARPILERAYVAISAWPTGVYRPLGISFRTDGWKMQILRRFWIWAGRIVEFVIADLLIETVKWYFLTDGFFLWCFLDMV